MAGMNTGQAAVGNTAPLASEAARYEAESRAREAAVAANEASKVVLNQGTPWEKTAGENSLQTSDPDAHYDQRNFMYGRDPNAAQTAVSKAYGVGDFALGQGMQLLTQNQQLAEQARGRVAPTGNFADQNSALGSSMGYGSQLAGLETTQGPSAAQAQLSQGTNQALSSQLALARSGRGFGGNAAAMGLAQGNTAGIMANNANQSAMLRAQEDAAWRGRQAANYGNAAAIMQGAGTQFGQQANTNLNAYLQNQAQNDAASLGYGGQGATALGQGIAGSFAGQGQANAVRGMEMQGGQAMDDRLLRAWAAKNGFQLAQDQAAAQQTGAMIQGGATALGTIIGAFGGPAGAAAGAGVGNAVGKAAAG